MNFIVSSTLLLKQLKTLAGVISSSNTLPILDNFLFELNQNELRVTASDLETTLCSSIEVSSQDTASVAIDSRLLIDTLSTFAEQPLTFKILENNILEIVSSHGNYKTIYADGDEFPQVIHMENPNQVSLPSAVLSNAIAKTIFATGNDDLRPIMNGVLFEFSSEHLTFVATDAHKLSIYRRKDIKVENEASFIVPRKPLNLLRKILSDYTEDNVKIEYNDKNALFVFDNVKIISRLIDGKYPNYNAVIPKENPNKLTINRSLLLNTSRRGDNFCNKETHQIRLKMTGASLEISAEDLDNSRNCNEKLTCNYQGDDMEIGFNSLLLIEMLSNLDSEEISIDMSLPNKAGILTPTDGLEENEEIIMLIMPVMLG